MSNNNMLYGSPVLLGDNTVPGVKYTPELEEAIPRILKTCTEFGLDYYPPLIELCTYDDISEIASYGGFPVRYPHWSFGMEYEEMSRGYEYGMHRIYEMVVNTNPCVLYCLDSNSLLDHVTVIAHALGHSHFFKNNKWFEPTTENALNDLANHGTRIRRYMDRWGRERVTQFMDWVLTIDTLTDFSDAWTKRTVKEVKIRDERKYFHPRKMKMPSTEGVDHDYMQGWIHDKEWKRSEDERVKKLEAIQEMSIFQGKEKNILGFLAEHAPLLPWQKDIIAMLYEEAQYFNPQRVTKMLNEGFASWTDYNIMARQRWAGRDGIYDYAKHKMGVLGGKYSMNPYAVGFKLLLYIEEKWNKGRFGREFDLCENYAKRKNWDTKAGLGHQKVFEVCEIHNDFTAINEFVDQEFVDKFELYVWKKFPTPDGGVDYRIESRDVKTIKKLLLQRYSNGSLPDIRLVDPNYAQKHIFLLEHQWDGRMLAKGYAQATLKNIWNIWNNGGTAGKRAVALCTKNKNGDEIVYVCIGNQEEAQSALLSRKEFEEQFS